MAQQESVPVIQERRVEISPIPLTDPQADEPPKAEWITSFDAPPQVLADPIDLAAELLGKLLAQVTQAGQQGLLDEFTTIDVESALRKALVLLRKPTPDYQTVLTHLTNAQISIATATQRGVDVGTMLGTLAYVITLVRG